MVPNKSNSSESQLDALIARIHGLASGVGKQPSAPPVNASAGPNEGVSEGGDGSEIEKFDSATHNGGEHPVSPPTGSVASSFAASPAPPESPALNSIFKDHVPTSGGPVVSDRQASDRQASGRAEVEQHGRLVKDQLAAASDRGFESTRAGYGSFSGGRESQGIPGRAMESRTIAEFAGASSFEVSRNEPWRPREPGELKDVGIPESSIEQLILKFLLARGEVEGRQVANQIKLPFRLVEPILESLKMDQCLAHKRGTATGDFAYILTDKGRAQARSYHSQCTYFGACPVPLQAYIESIKQQTVEGQKPQKHQLEQAFADLLINPKMLDRLGPAVNSGRGMFLYGFPGNGKTSIAERVTAAFGKWIWIPRAIDIDGDVLRVYDRMNHEEEMPETSAGLLNHGGFDSRWIRIRRPTIVVGGELTMDMLEVQTNRQTNISEAPLQLKSNCGTLVIDDFGRQKISVDQLLNRWIVPLEKRYDFLNMRSGKKIQVPFDQLVVFSTNLEPRDLVDDAFLRRIPYKIEVRDPSEGDFRKLFEIMCRVLKILYQPEPIDYLINKHYKPIDRPFRNCQPRDLLLQVQNYCRYQGIEVELRDEYFDYAVENYFSIM